MSLAGYTRVCGLQSGGVKYLYLALAADVTSFTKTTEAYTAATMESGRLFKKYEFEPDTCEFKEDVSYENSVGKITKTIDLIIAKMSDTGRAMVSELLLSSPCGMIAIIEDSNGTKWVVGYTENFLKSRPLYAKSIAGTTGKKISDPSQYTVSLTTDDNEPCRIFSGTVPIS